MTALIAQERALMAVEASAGRDRLRGRDARGVRRRIALRPDVPLAPLTTFRVGGPAEWLIETRNSDEIVAALRARARAPACR